LQTAAPPSLPFPRAVKEPAAQGGGNAQSTTPRRALSTPSRAFFQLFFLFFLFFQLFSVFPAKKRLGRVLSRQEF
jgi:hypothetical protein